VIIYDPTEAVAAAHAGQFHADCVRLVPLRFTGLAPQRLIASGGLMMQMLRALNNGRLTRARMAAMIRPVRRADPGYLWDLARRAQADGRFARARRIADYAADVTGEARFAELARQLAS
jgi:hypothetical protein